jgi:glucoamylase
VSRRQFLTAALAPGLLGACSSLRIGTGELSSAEGALEEWITKQRTLSIQHLLNNTSPAVTFQRDVEARFIAPDRQEIVRSAASAPEARVQLEGNRIRQQIVPRAGSVTAAPPGTPSEPDYFFHWVRDSALVMHALATLCAAGSSAQIAVYDERIADFIRFSRTLQTSAAPEGLGEVRFNMDGTQDFLLWNRPQFDGPALRALALMHYQRIRGDHLPEAIHATLHEVVQADLDYIVLNSSRPGFDLWEELKGYDFHARAVQAAALHAGARRALSTGASERANAYEEASRQLQAAMQDHWLEEKGYYGFFAGRTVDLQNVEQTKPGENLDTAVLMAAVHGRMTDGRYSLLDDRILATAVRLEDFFAERYGLNRRRASNEGIVYGRYQGDTYYGGNPWVFITATVAEACYRLAELVARGASLPVTSRSQSFIERALRRAGAALPAGEGERGLSDSDLRRLPRGLILRGDDILRAMQRWSSNSGALPEQYDQESGAPASAANLSWSHAALLAATDARTAALANLNPNESPRSVLRTRL